MANEEFPPLDPVRAVQDALNNQRKEKIRLAARRRILVELAGQVLCGAQQGPQVTTGQVIDAAESLLTEIEKRYGADW